MQEVIMFKMIHLHPFHHIYIRITQIILIYHHRIRRLPVRQLTVIRHRQPTETNMH